MVNFIIIALVLLLIVFLTFKMNNYRTKLAFIFIFLGVAFLLLTGYIIFSGKEINLTTVQGVSSALKTYASWLSTAASNVVNIGGYTIKQDWKDNEKELEENPA